MTKQKLQQLFMLQLLLGFCKNNQLTVDLVAAFKGGVTSITNFVSQIIALLGSQSKSVAGGGSQKEQARNSLNIITFAIINVVKGYAISIKDQDLKAEMSMSLSKIQKISDKRMAAVAADWIKKVAPLLSKLQPWGLTNNSMLSWNRALDSYNATFLLPATKRKNRKDETAEMYALLSEAMDVCKSTLDTSINSYKELDKEQFMAQYKTYRQQTPIASQHTRLDAMVTNELGEACVNCKVTVNAFTKKDKTYQAVSAVTDIMGHSIVSEFEPGIRSVTISGENIQSKTFTDLSFTKGKALQQIFVCTPSFDSIPAAKQDKENVKQ